MDIDAIVIGGGAAGLAAARSLAARGLAARPARVLLLEARDRLGGRVLWRSIPGVATPAEFGAEFIHGKARRTMELLHEAGMKAITVEGESWIDSGDGELRRQSREFTSFAAIFNAARSLATDESADRFLRRFEADSAMREEAESARAFVEGFDAADPATASARAIADEWRSSVDWTTSRPLGGYGPLFDRLGDACVTAGAQIRTSVVVRRIAWRRGDVEIEATDVHGKSQTLRARAVIVTLPIGVLRHAGDGAVSFDPALPQAKHEALHFIEMGHAKRIVLWFKSPFWERLRNGRYANAAFFRGEGQAFGAFWTQYPVRSELVTAWAGGPKAIALIGVPQADLVERALNDFGELLNEPKLARQEYAGGAMHDWTGDQFSRGAYSYVAVGGESARAVLAEPVDGTLFFAGEATSTDGQGGTVNGALDTGERAAAEAAASLDIEAFGGSHDQ